MTVQLPSAPSRAPINPNAAAGSNPGELRLGATSVKDRLFEGFPASLEQARSDTAPRRDDADSGRLDRSARDSARDDGDAVRDRGDRDTTRTDNDTADSSSDAVDSSARDGDRDTGRDRAADGEASKPSADREASESADAGTADDGSAEETAADEPSALIQAVGQQLKQAVQAAQNTDANAQAAGSDGKVTPGQAIRAAQAGGSAGPNANGLGQNAGAGAATGAATGPVAYTTWSGVQPETNNGSNGENTGQQGQNAPGQGQASASTTLGTSTLSPAWQTALAQVAATTDAGAGVLNAQTPILESGRGVQAVTAVNPQALGGAEASTGTNSEVNTARLGRALNAAAQQQGGTVTLRLTPAELGTVRIQLDLQGTQLSARLHTETDAARNLIQQQLHQLRAGLEGQGLTVERVTVQSMQGSGQSAFQQDSAADDGRSRGGTQQQNAGRDTRDQSDSADQFRELFRDAAEPDSAAPNAA